jgi:Xaa-Pro aminopeptidase
VHVRSLPALALVAALITPALAGAQIGEAEYARRREALVARLPEGALVAFGAREPKEDYLSFFQSPRFAYLTGLREPEAALVMIKRGGTVSSTIFVETKDPAREVWSGMRLGAAAVGQRTGLAARAADSLLGVLDSLAGSGLPLFVVGEFDGCDDVESRGFASPDQQIVARLRADHPNLQARVANCALDRLRGTKSAAELELIRRAVDITVQAQREAMKAIEPGMNEFEIQAIIEYTFRRNGADRPGFATIIGSGPNSTTLHYNADDRFMAAGEVVVMDVGASYRGYSADITRTVPVSGTFTPAQRELYQLVRNAQAAAERQAKVGAPAQRMSDSSLVVLKTGLARLGLIESPDATFDPAEGDPCPQDQQTRRCPQWFLYYMHGLGHGIGLEVHDPEQYYFTGTIAPGSAFTLEPGVYVRGNLLEILPDTPRNRDTKNKLRAAVTKYANIGIRIEDDYIVTADGVQWISRAPREIAEIEALMRESYAGPPARDAATVEAYRRMR